MQYRPYIYTAFCVIRSKKMRFFLLIYFNNNNNNYYYYYYYYYYYTIWMSLVTGLFFLVLLLNQR